MKCVGILIGGIAEISGIAQSRRWMLRWARVREVDSVDAFGLSKRQTTLATDAFRPTRQAGRLPTLRGALPSRIGIF